MTIEVVARADSAALTHGFVDACAAGHGAVLDRSRSDRTGPQPPAYPCRGTVGSRRSPPRSDEREGADVAEITDLIDHRPAGPEAPGPSCREEPHPGAQLTFTDVDGHRFQVFITDQTDPTSPTSKPCIVVEAEPKAHLQPQGHRPGQPAICRHAINNAWLTLVLIAQTYSPGPNWCARRRTRPRRTRATATRSCSGQDHRSQRPPNPAAHRQRLAYQVVGSS